MTFMWKFAGLALLTLSVAIVSPAPPPPPNVPEIDPSSGLNALALVSGIALVVRSRRR